MKPLTYQFLLLFWTILCLIAYLIHIFNHSYIQSDFRAFYAAGHIYKTQPTQLYNLDHQIEVQQTINPFNYPLFPAILPYASPPSEAAILSLFTVFPPTITYRILQSILIILYVFTLYLFHKHFKIKHLNPLLIAISFPAIYLNLLLTQNAIPSLLILYLIYKTIQTQRNLAAGLLLGTIWYMPPIALIPTLYGILLKRPQLYLGLALGILLQLVFFLIADISPINYIKFLLNYTQMSADSAYLISLQGALTQLNLQIYPIPVRPICYLLSILLISNTLFHLYRHQPQHLTASKFSFLIITILLAGSHIHHYQLILLIFPFYQLLSQTPNLNTNHYLILTLTWTITLFTAFSPLYPNPVPFLPQLLLLYFYYYYYQKIHYSQIPAFKF